MKILKKVFAVAMILVLSVTVIAGCKDNRVESSKTNSTEDKTTSTSTGNNTGSSGKVIKEGTIQKEGNVILKELAVSYNGKTVAISDIVDDEKLEGIMGKAVEKKSHTYTNGDGLNMDTLIGFTEKQYKFPGLEIKAIKVAKGKDFHIFNIKITDSKYSTVRNIKVGDSLEKLKEAYPEGNLIGGGGDKREDVFRYEPVNYVDVMNFHIKNNKIQNILIYKLLD